MALRVTGEGRSLLSALGHDWGGPSAHAAPPTPAATADVTRMAEGMSAIDRVKQSFGLLTRKTSESSAVQKILEHRLAQSDEKVQNLTRLLQGEREHSTRLKQRIG